MQDHVTDLTEGKPSKIIFRFYMPLLFTYMLQQLYNIVDSMIVGKGIGDDALAAVGNMGSLTFLIIGSCTGLANGFCIPIGQEFGAEKYERMRKYVANSILLSIGISVISCVFSIVNLKDILIKMQVDGKIISDSLSYGYIIFGGIGVTLAYNLAGAVLRALGESKTPFIAILIATITNIVLDILFVFLLKLGVFGVAVATVISQAISAIICIRKIFKIELLRLKKEEFHFEAGVYIELLKNGIPMAIMNSVTAIGCMVVQYFVNGFGVVYTAAYAICSRYINLFMQPSFAIGQAMSAFTSQNYGAKKYDRIRQGTFVCLGFAFVSYIIFAVLMVGFPNFLAGLMLNGTEQISLAADFLPMCGIMMWTVDFLFVFRSGCQGMGISFVPMFSGVLEMALRIMVIVFFMNTVGFMATAYAEIAAWSGALLVNAVMFLFAGKDNKNIVRRSI